jgi:hypothetical protein
MIEVRNDVMRQTNGKQVPWDSSSLTGRFFFRIEGTITVAPEGASPGAPATAPVDPKALELAVWQAIRDTNDRAAFEQFLSDFPSGVFASAARSRIAALRAPVVETPARAPSTAERSEACASPAAIDDDFSASVRTVGIGHGVQFTKGPNGGAGVSPPRAKPHSGPATNSVWISAQPEEHMTRVMKQGDFRPMAKNREAMADLHAILESRRDDYARAEARLDTSGATEQQSLARLLRLVAPWMKG